MVVALVQSCGLLPLSRELSDLVLPHACAWYAAALQLFLEAEAVIYLVVVCLNST